MKVVFSLALAISISINLWLITADPPEPYKTPGPSVVQTKSVVVAAPMFRALATADSVHRINEVVRSAEGNLISLRDMLRSHGASEEIVRAVLEGLLRRRAELELSARRQRLATSWWLVSSARRNESPGNNAKIAQELVGLLGRDPIDIRDAERKYDFVSAEKRHLLAAIDLDYMEMRNGQSMALGGVPLKGDQDVDAALLGERRADMLAALTPQERAEYDLRFSQMAGANLRRFATMTNLSEEEFRAIKPIVDDYAASGQSLARGQNTIAEAELNQKTVDHLVRTIGYARTEEYIWSVPGLYTATADSFRAMNLPATNAAQLFQIAAETGVQAASIHQDVNLSEAQKESSLATLQQSASGRLANVVTNDQMSALPPESTEWFRLLSEGKYILHTPTLLGSGWSQSEPVSVRTLWRGPPSSAPVLKKG